MRAFADERGTLFILYRTAAENVHRDMTLLISTDQGVTFHDTTVGPWELNACPMSTAYLSEGRERVRAAWERAGQVYFDSVEPLSLKVTAPIAAPGESNNRKHPAVAANVNGQVLMAWPGGTGWSRGGHLPFHVFFHVDEPASVQWHEARVLLLGLAMYVPL